MKKYHITKDGPKKCSAREGNCPITKSTDEKHYTDLNIANRVYEEKMQEEATQSLNKILKFNVKNVNLPKTELQSKLLPKKGGSYYGLTVNENSVQPHLEEWRKEIGEKNAREMENAKINRDGGYHFHITALSPKETRQLKKSGTKIEMPDFKINFTGIGSVQDGEKEAWFITVDSPEIDEYRKTLNLPKHHLHVTIGFKNGDIHNKPKDQSSLRIV